MKDAVRDLIDMALREDIGPSDLTTENLVDEDQIGQGQIIAKQSLVLAGLQVARQVFEKLDSTVQLRAFYTDGNEVPAGRPVLEVSGRLRALLMGERVALNFLQRLSGIATGVRSYVKAMPKDRGRIVDTRKTTPGWRVLEKYAVRVGGGSNHRLGLFDGVLIKDNHIAVCGGIKPCIERIRPRISHLLKIEVEVCSLPQVTEALEAGADVIMLDNMELAQIKNAVAQINGQALVEVSGGVRFEDLKALAEAGVDIISVGALTHSARSVDLSMQITPSAQRRIH